MPAEALVWRKHLGGRSNSIAFPEYQEAASSFLDLCRRTCIQVNCI